MSSADDIRAKRLAKLNLARNSEQLSSELVNENIPSPKRPANSPAIETPKEKEIEITSTNIPNDKKQKNVEPKPIVPVVQTPQKSPEEHLSDWLIDEIETLFRATIKHSHEPKLVYLPSLASEIETEHILLGEDSLEQIFMEILTDLGVPSSFATTMEYLFSVYYEAKRSKRLLVKKSNTSKGAILNKVIELATSYAFICFQASDMFINNDIAIALDFIIGESSKNNDIIPFIMDITQQSIEQDSLLDLLNVFLPALSAKIYKSSLNDPSYPNYLSMIEMFVSNKQIASVFSQVEGFNPPNENNCLDYEHKTLLGPILRLSPLLENVGENYFSGDVQNLSRVQLNASYESVQNEYKVVIDRLFFIIDKLIRGSAQTRQDVLKWFCKLVNLNHLRRGSHADLKKLASDGIMFNISVILVKLSLPFLDYPTFNKIDKIDMDYFGKTNFINIKEESRINSSIQEADEYFESQALENNTNFISDCFYLSLAYLHFGIGGIFLHLDRIKSQLKQFEERIAMIENNHAPPGVNPMMLQIMRSQLPKLKRSFNLLQTTKHSIQAIFSFRNLQLEIFDFVVGASTFFTRVIDPEHTYPKSKLSIPIFKIGQVSELDDHDFLITKAPKPWKYYPEFIIEGIVNYCKFTTSFRGCPLVQNFEKMQSLVEFAVILLRCPELIGNPHMKAYLVEILFIGSLPLNDGSPGFISQVFSSNKLVMDNILYSLLDFYVMVEKTGASSQFYDKFNSRYYISVIIEELWKYENYRVQLHNYAKNNVNFFIRFIARMLNDTTYLLDESFNELNSIHNFQQELRVRSTGIEGNVEDFGTTEELTNNLASSEKKAKSYMGLSNKTMQLFKLFTKEVPEGFILPEVIDRLAGMLNYNLSIMVGPKCSNLKVEDPEKYDFRPKETLTDLCEIYCNLANQESFVIAVSRDGRSFNILLFEKAQRILSTKTYTNSKLIDCFINFAKNAESKRKEDEDEELELGEIPDEFLDPLMYTLMEDPVILPSSKISIDRSTIKAHLLSDATDPFNRMPLKLEDVIDDTDLKEKIRAFKVQKKAERKNNVDTEMTDA